MEFSGRSLMILAGLLAVFTGCVRVKTDPIRIEPIYIEITVNHRIQKELDTFFAEIDKASETTTYSPLDPAEPNPESE
jgi:hypothetical protein